MININSVYQKAVRIQKLVCGLLFSLFSFIYLFVFQRDVLEALHFSLAHGKTHFSPFGSALVMTLTLLLLTWGINKLAGIKGKFYSLIYLPAFFVLMAISDIKHDIFIHGGNTMWLWILPVVFGLFLCLALICNKAFPLKKETDTTVTGVIKCNVLFLLIGCIATISVGNTNENFHHELEIERCLRDKNYLEAMQVGKHSMEATRNLTALRALALSNAGQLGDKLFTYPNYFGADGLFLTDDTLQNLRYTNDSIYNHLGARPYNGADKLYFLRTLCYEEKGKFTSLDYYLSALLLKKRLDAFAEAITDFVEPGDTLPLHFKEALVIYKLNHPSYPFVISDTTLLRKYSLYKHRQIEFSSKIKEKNQMRREFGDTYWWYHDYQE